MLNVIDHHNLSHQSDLGLEKQWVTQDCYFQLVMTLLGMHEVDCWKLADYHGIINSKAMEENKMSIKKFAGILGHQLVTKALAFSLHPVQGTVTRATISVPSLAVASVSMVTLNVDDPKVVVPDRMLIDANGVSHHQVRFPVGVSIAGKKRRTTRQCKTCDEHGERHLVQYYCYTCGMAFAFCCPDSYNTDRDCFMEHVEDIDFSRNTRTEAAV